MPKRTFTVKRTFTLKGKAVEPGTEVTGDLADFRTLISKGYLDLSTEKPPAKKKKAPSKSKQD